jgi:hypothetical protein
MMNLTVMLFTVVLFVLLTPGIVTRLPPAGSKLTVAIVHGLIFALVYHFTHKMVFRYSMAYEGFEGCKKCVDKKCMDEGANHAAC